MSIFRLVFRWITTHLFRNYIRRGVGFTWREFMASLFCIFVGLFWAYMLTEEPTEAVPLFASLVIQIIAVALPWFGGLLAFGFLFGRRFGYEPLRDVDMMAAGRSGGYAAAAAAGFVTLSKLAGQLWGG